MLKLQSFKIGDSAGMNELLSKYRLAKGATILISNGELCIPYEDGEPMNAAHKINEAQEQKNEALNQIDLIEHSQNVLEILMRDAQSRIDTAKADVDAAGKGKSSEKDKANTALSRAESAFDQLKTQHEQNAHEIARLTLNVELFDERIAELSA